MIDAGGPSTGEVAACFPWCACPTGGGHGLTIDDATQRCKGAKRRVGAPYGGVVGNSDPMIEADAPSTGGWVVPAPPGVVILAPPTLLRSAEREHSERPRQKD